EGGQVGPARGPYEGAGRRDRGGAAPHRWALGFARRGRDSRRGVGCRARPAPASRPRQLDEGARRVGRRKGGGRRPSRGGVAWSACRNGGGGGDGGGGGGGPGGGGWRRGGRAGVAEPAARRA